MTYTPVEIRHVRLSRGLLGYRVSATKKLLDEITESFETVWRDRADLADKIESLEADLVRYRDMEQLLRNSLVSAERNAHELRDQARREAVVIVDEAHAEARAITREAAGVREQLLAEARRIRTLLNAALDALDEAEELDEVVPKHEPAEDSALRGGREQSEAA
jgi:cell division initiation protein